MVYYNEFDKQKAAWLRELIKCNAIAPGDVDERSIRDVQPSDLKSYKQCHFFAGIGVWSYALRLAGWSDDRPIWTGSCPCQPFSVAGKQGGFNDERHLWPEWFRLIKECKPPTVLGEQSASKVALSWIDLVQTDMEGAGYAFGAVDTCAAGFGAPHIRQRLYFVGDSNWSHSDVIHGNISRGLGRFGELSNDKKIPNPGGVTVSCEPRPATVADGPTTNLVAVRGYGDAIVVPQAVAFIESVLDIVG